MRIIFANFSLLLYSHRNIMKECKEIFYKLFGSLWRPRNTRLNDLISTFDIKKRKFVNSFIYTYLTCNLETRIYHISKRLLSSRRYEPENYFSVNSINLIAEIFKRSRHSRLNWFILFYWFSWLPNKLILLSS